MEHHFAGEVAGIGVAQGNDGRMRDALADCVDEGQAFLRVGLQAGGAQVDKEHVAILLEIGMIAFKIVAAAREEAHQKIGVNFFGQRGIAADDADAYESFSRSCFGPLSRAGPGHRAYTPSYE